MEDDGASDIASIKTALPPYTQYNASVITLPPSYKLQASGSNAGHYNSPLLAPYRSFPSTINVISHIGGFKTFICGGPNNERLYYVEPHTGFSGKPPLGKRPGFYVHNGDKDAPILGVCGSMSQYAESPVHDFGFSNDSIIFLPQCPGTGIIKNAPDMLVKEMMQAHTKGDSYDGVYFRFSVEVGQKCRRETFEWRKIKKTDDHEARNKSGFKLFRVHTSSTSSSNPASSSHTVATDNEELVALLVLHNRLISIKSVLTLDFRGRGQSEELGERWKLMVIMTALRLYYLKSLFGTNKKVIATGEEIDKSAR